MYCGKCGKEIKEGLKFCTGCGNPVTAQIQVPQSNTPYTGKNQKPERKRKTWIIILAVIAGLALLLAAAWFIVSHILRGNTYEPYYTPYQADDIIENGNDAFVNNELLLTARGGTKPSDIRKLVAKEDGEVVGYIPQTDDYQISFSGDHSIEDLAKISNVLQRDSNVASVSLHEVYELSDDSIDYLADPWDNSEDPENVSGKEWTTEKSSGNNWWAEAIEMPVVWEQDRDFETIKIGVYDSMFDLSNPDLQDVFAKTWNNPADEEQMDEGHGTHVAGLIGAKGENDFGIVGVCQNAEMYGFASNLPEKDKETNTRWGDVFETKYCVSVMLSEGVQILNFSRSFREVTEKAENGEEEYVEKLDAISSSYEKFLKKLINQGYDFLIVKSAGNNTDKSINPRDAKYDILGAIEDESVRNHILMVGAASNHETYYTRSDISYAGDRVDVYAPGKYILSDLPHESTGVRTGTSMAAPIVTGLAGLVWGTNKDFTAETVKEIITNSGNPVVIENVWSPSNGKEVRIVNAPNALQIAELYSTGNKDSGAPDKGIIAGMVYEDSSDEDDPMVMEEVHVTAQNARGEIIESDNDAETGYELVLAPGNYTIRVKKDGYNDFETDVSVESGRVYEMDIRMNSSNSKGDKKSGETDFEFVKRKYLEARNLCCGTFLWQNDTDTSDTIRDIGLGGNELDFFRVKYANTIEKFMEYCNSIYTENVTQELMQSHIFKEKNGKLYIDQSMGLGGPGVTAVQLKVTRENDEEYSVEIFETWDVEMDTEPYTLYLKFVNGNWVWNNYIFADDDVIVTSA